MGIFYPLCVGMSRFRNWWNRRTRKSFQPSATVVNWNTTRSRKRSRSISNRLKNVRSRFTRKRAQSAPAVVETPYRQPSLLPPVTRNQQLALASQYSDPLVRNFLSRNFSANNKSTQNNNNSEGSPPLRFAHVRGGTR